MRIRPKDCQRYANARIAFSSEEEFREREDIWLAANVVNAYRTLIDPATQSP